MREEDNIKLEPMLVGNIAGDFFIADYQRGYRWGKDEVTRLLEDIASSEGKNYCLQPIVVKKDGNRYELIDGQQRLTTILLIQKYIKKHLPMSVIKISINYDTRKGSKKYLDSFNYDSIPDINKANNIDEYFFIEVATAIKEWFEAPNAGDATQKAIDFQTAFNKSVKVIWYEVSQQQDSIELFTRLNIGKIPLTSAELIKALFLRGKADGENPTLSEQKQDEISLQWDNIEKELHNEKFWYFLTNASKTKFQTRIDLVLDLISQKPTNCRDKYFTFFSFAAKDDLDKVWQDEIQHTFLVLKDWYEHHKLYHKIGYLISSNYKSLLDIYNLSLNKTKTSFIQELDESIRESVKIDTNYANLSYEIDSDRAYISRLLLLFNIESVRRNGESTQWFPFDKYKYSDTGKVIWSLEHIHAQQSEGLKKQEDWKKWIKLHIQSIKSLGNCEDLVLKMQEAYENPKLDRVLFENIQAEVEGKLSAAGSVEYKHRISNLALLNTADNAALNNSAFDAKRNEIIRMDKEGKFIPFCTRMVFLKYYTPSEKTQLQFWAQPDRIAYVKAINEVLQKYLQEPIEIEKEY